MEIKNKIRRDYRPDIFGKIGEAGVSIASQMGEKELKELVRLWVNSPGVIILNIRVTRVFSQIYVIANTLNATYRQYLSHSTGDCQYLSHSTGDCQYLATPWVIVNILVTPQGDSWSLHG